MKTSKAPFARFILRLTIIGGVLGFLPLVQNPAWAQKAANAKAGGRDELITAKDGWQLHCTWFPSSSGAESPVVIMLPAAEGHDAKSARTRKIWEKSALNLQSNGYAVMTVDLRKHGDSVPAAASSGTGKAAAVKLGPNDYTLMAAADLESVKEFLLAEHEKKQLNIGRLGILSAGSSSAVSMAFAAADWSKPPYQDAPAPGPGEEDRRTQRGRDVRALMMLTPKHTVKGLNTIAALRVLNANPVAFHVIVSAEDSDGVKESERIFKAVKLKGDEYKEVRLMTSAPVKAVAEGFLEGKEADGTNKLMLSFLNRNLKEIQVPWKTRKSRL
jgi:hypothetical protein